MQAEAELFWRSEEAGELGAAGEAPHSPAPLPLKQKLRRWNSEEPQQEAGEITENHWSGYFFKI